MKELGQTLLVSKQTIIALDAPERALFTDLGERTLKGKNEMVHIFGMKY